MKKNINLFVQLELNSPAPKGESLLISRVLSPPLEGGGGWKARFMKKPFTQNTNNHGKENFS